MLINRDQRLLGPRLALGRLLPAGVLVRRVPGPELASARALAVCLQYNREVYGTQ